MEILAALFVVLVVLAFWAQRGTYVLQYLFFVRHPILVGLVLAVVLPLGACDAAGAPFENVFVLERGWQLGLVILLAVQVSWVVMYTLGVMWTKIPTRVSLMFLRKGRRNGASRWSRGQEEALVSGWTENDIPVVLERVRTRLVLFSLLAVPVIATCYLASSRLEGKLGWLAVYPALVGTVAWVVGRITSRSVPALLSRPVRFLFLAVPRRLDPLVFGRDPEPKGKEESTVRTGYEDHSENFLHQNAGLFATITLALYVVGFFLGPRAEAGGADEIPALAYVLVLLMLVGWVLPGFAFFFDKSRVLPEIVLLALIATLYGAFGTDNYYELVRDDGDSSHEIEAADLVRAWDDDRPIVVVAASGGGIAAAYWTALVLDELQSHEELAGFASSIRLISSTSGGAVGAMYYVDAYSRGADGQMVPPANPEAIVESAGESSLSAMIWGLVYPDFLRLFYPLVRYGRGKSLETRWGQSLASSADTTLSRWAEGVREGWRPMMVFNATLVESGEHMAIAPLTVRRGPGSSEPYLREDGGGTEGRLVGRERRKDFRRFYDGADLRVVTAARLSATFPWVSPVSRPDGESVPAGRGYHVADGGYYDNYSLVGAMEFLNQVLPAVLAERSGSGGGPTRVLLVQIRLSGSDAPPRAKEDAGFRMETLGPVDTMLAVRGTSQLARNDLELDLLVAAWAAEGVVIRSFAFECGIELPLSWHLSSEDKDEIREAWESASRSELDELTDCWSEWTH